MQISSLRPGHPLQDRLQCMTAAGLLLQRSVVSLHAGILATCAPILYVFAWVSCRSMGGTRRKRIRGAVIIAAAMPALRRLQEKPWWRTL